LWLGIGTGEYGTRNPVHAVISELSRLALIFVVEARQTGDESETDGRWQMADGRWQMADGKRVLGF
jgi:hypothetical protein